MMKTITAGAIVATVAASTPQQDLVDKINNHPGILWKAAPSKLVGSMKNLLGVWCVWCVWCMWCGVVCV